MIEDIEGLQAELEGPLFPSGIFLNRDMSQFCTPPPRSVVPRPTKLATHRNMCLQVRRVELRRTYFPV